MKLARHEEILKLIDKYDIDTQEELVKRLNESGFSATQATVSRDIRELKLIKMATGKGGVRYTASQKKSDSDGKYLRTFRDAVISIQAAGNLLVIKTEAGMAMASAEALDQMNIPEIVGCIAGDNTIFAAIETAQTAQEVLDKLRKIIG